MSLVKPCESYFIAAGEHSGDLLGADLVLALKDKLPRHGAFGVTGATMARAGVDSVASIDELGVMGVVEVARKLPELKMLESRLLQRIDQRKPRFAILIDNPGFNLRLAEQLKLRGVKVFQYVAPKLWAWGEGRAPRLRRDVDTVLGILPFEADFFAARGINYVYVGSPVKDRIEKVVINRGAFGLTADQPLIACLPGSREAELRRILPLMARTRDIVGATLPDAVFVVPVAPNLSWDDVGACLRGLGSVDAAGSSLRPRQAGEGLAVASYDGAGLRFVRGMSLEVMAAADAALVASGTATLECGLLGTPMVVVYAMNDLTYQIARSRVKLPYVSLINLVAQRQVVNEYIQEFALRDVAADLVSLLSDRERRLRVQRELQEIRDKLKGRAAEAAAAVIAERCG
jgi:lipid-A-disaccharide synthase